MLDSSVNSQESDEEQVHLNKDGVLEEFYQQAIKG